MKMLKRGDSGLDVQTLQSKLLLKQDAQFGPVTEKAVIRFQLANGLPVTGIVDSDMWTLLFNKVPTIQEAIDEDSDISDQYFKTNFDQIIHKYYLSPKEYIKGPIKNEYIFLHHTAGNNNPFACVDMWNKDDRGAIGTEFVLGGQSVFTGNDLYDGTVVQAFPEGAYGWHLGDNGSEYMHKHSVGIEVCNFGPIKDGKTYTGQKANPLQIVELKESFRGHKTWHRYSDKQLLVLKDLILHIADRDDIDISKGLISEIKKNGAKGFEFNSDAYYGKVKGMWTHTNTRKDKSDMFPQQELIDMLLSL